MAEGNLIVRGAREHNLRNVDVEIPRDKLTAITGRGDARASSGSAPLRRVPDPPWA